MHVDRGQETYARNRRGFLRGLAALPLIGGSMQLIGNPTGVADTYSPKLLGCYLEWLRLERQQLGEELGLVAAYGEIPLLRGAGAAHRHCRDFVGTDLAYGPSSRAAVVLSAVGCDWTGGGRA